MHTGDTLSIPVTFSPTSVGVSSGSLTVETDAGTVAIALAGRGVSANPELTITPTAIKESFKHPREINQDLVNAQQARRVVDRLVGYTMSPLLWKKIRYGLSAGRVQSVALRLIVDREREIQKFTAEEYWSIEALLANHTGDAFGAEVIQHKGHKLAIGNATDAEKHRAALADAVYKVASVEKRTRNGQVRWYARYRDPSGAQRTKTFDRKVAVIGRSMEQAIDDNGFTFGIVCNGALAGVIGQHYIDLFNRRTELGYWLDAAHQGRGIVTRSTARLTDYAFASQDCNRVILHCAVGNFKSRAVAERLGFVQEGVLREAEWLYDHYVDLVVYSMLKSQWSGGNGRPRKF